jgi:hypothetical protein
MWIRMRAHMCVCGRVKLHHAQWSAPCFVIYWWHICMYKLTASLKTLHSLLAWGWHITHLTKSLWVEICTASASLLYKQSFSGHFYTSVSVGFSHIVKEKSPASSTLCSISVTPNNICRLPPASMYELAWVHCCAMCTGSFAMKSAREESRCGGSCL